jgi:hypothetical protein
MNEIIINNLKKEIIMINNYNPFNTIDSALIMQKSTVKDFTTLNFIIYEVLNNV